MPSTEQPVGQDEKSQQFWVHGIDPMEVEITRLCAHVSVKVYCWHDQDHEFYLPFNVTQHESPLFCPICKKSFPRCKGRYDFNNVKRLYALLEKILLLLPPATKDEIQKMMSRSPSTLS